MTPQRVLVTGGSGFIAGHCILRLLEQGYLVRATVLSLHREPEVRTALTDAGMLSSDALSFVEAPDAAGQRFLVASDEPAVAMREIGAILKARLGEAAPKVPTRNLPNVIVRIAALFSAEFRPVAADLGYVKQVSNEKARRVLGRSLRTSEQAIIASAESLIAKALV